MKNDIAEDSKPGAVKPLTDVRDLPLARVRSLADAGLIGLNQPPMSNAGVSVAAFNSSI
ncbi:hypothetical protein AB0O34_10615 [Sphaerisporangium sp. NPDC088356]|uniref:hypothetical protein n=1 Tax=Sphaerisporangium sp. NPDC088356 TaxID=3154871 RepID=UPI00343871DA